MPTGERMALFPPGYDWNRAGWRVAQAANIAITAALIFSLFWRPDVSLPVMWNILIPLLPASFLIAPALWRGICPLATLNQWAGGLLGRRQLGNGLVHAANGAGMLLLLLLVPARRFALNENGPVLAVVIIIVGLLAIGLGSLFDGRAGFCNAICPVLPVERLYGQHPLLKLDNRRCDRCTLCIPKACIDVDAAKSLNQVIARSSGRHGWLTGIHGIFAGVMPGLIVGYFTTSNGPWTSALAVYSWVVLCCLASYLITLIAVWLLNLDSSISLALLAATAVALYYWWALPGIIETLHIGEDGILFGRVAALVLVGYWFMRYLPYLRLGANR